MDKSKTKKKENTYFKNYDLYSDANPKDTIRIKYATLKDVKETINKLERIYKNGTKPHNRISQIVNVMVQRLRVIDVKSQRFKLANKYFDFLKSRTKEKDDKKRKKLVFRP
jgi:hypothetical protein